MIIQPLKYIVTNHSIVYNVCKLQIDYMIVCLYTCDHLIGKNQFSSREYIFHFLLILLKTKDGWSRSMGISSVGTMFNSIDGE